MSTPAHIPTTPLYTLHTHSAPINALIFSTPTSLQIPYILTGSSDRAIHLSNPSRGIPSSTPSTTTTTTTKPTPPSRNSAPVSPGLIHAYTGHAYAVLDIAVSRDNARFISGGGDRLVFLWDVETGQTVRRFGSTVGGHTGRVECVAFGGDESVVVSGSQDTTLRLWDAKSGAAKPIQILDEARDTVACVCVRDHAVLTGSTDGRVRFYDLRMGSVTSDCLGYPITSLTLTKDAQALLSTTLHSTHTLLDLSTGVPLKAYTAPTYTNTALRLRSTLACNDSIILSGTESPPAGDADGPEQAPSKGIAGEILAWDVLTGDVVARLDHHDLRQGSSGKNRVVGVVAWTEGRGKARGKGGWWASGGSDGSVKVWGDGGEEK